MIPMRTGMRLVMVGRRRKSGRRQPNGQPARVYVNPKAQVAAQPHRMGVVTKFRDRQEAESPFGRLMLNGIITPAMYEAGRAYAALAGQYRGVMGIPSPDPRAIDLGSYGRSVGGDIPSDVARSIKDRYNAAFESLPGNAIQRAVAEHAVREKPVGDSVSREMLKIGLSTLVRFFGLDENLQINDSRN